MNVGFSYYDHPDWVDSVMGKGFAQFKLDFLIRKTDILPRIDDLKNGEEPDWVSIERQLKSKYGPGYARRNILAARSSFYFQRKNWPLYTRYSIMQVLELGTDTTQV